MAQETPRPVYAVKTPQFEGPIDVLLTLAHRGEVDLREIPLHDIADTYLKEARHSLDLEQATEVLWMLAHLVEMKARLLLPKAPPADAPPPEEAAGDLEAQLEERLAEYRAFKEAAAALRALEAYERRVFARPPEEHEEVPLLLEGLTLEDLFAAFRRVLERAKDAGREIPGEGISVAQRMDDILAMLRSRPEGLSFQALFPAEATRLEVIVTFLALLELINQRQIRVRQARAFAPIWLVLAT